MRYLAIDTSGDLIVVAHDDKNCVSRYLKGCNTKHSITLMPYVEECMGELKLQLSDLDFIAVVVGPGSFTGIRIGVSTAKALCYALNKPLLSLTSFDLLAYSDNAPVKSVCLIDANHDNFYACAYENGYRVKNAEFNTKEQVLNDYEGYKMVASQQIEGLDIFVADIESGLKNAILALKDRTTSYEECVPLYIKRSQAEEESC